jgi:thiamine biosynthesis lipoprotein ApbE
MVTKIAMASPVRIIATASASTDAVAAAWAAIRAVESSCNRFDPSSELSLLNAHSREAVAISPLLCDLVGIALAGYRSTNGRFDPRVLSDLERMGYDRTFRSVDGLGASMADRPERTDWTPEFDSKLSLVTLGGERIDLGGVAKGAAADRGLAAMAAMGHRCAFGPNSGLREAWGRRPARGGGAAQNGGCTPAAMETRRARGALSCRS